MSTDLTHITVMGRVFDYFLGRQSSSGTRLLVILLLSVGSQMMVKAFRQLTEWIIQRSHTKKTSFAFVTEQPKFVTFTKLIASSVTFIIYFVAVGLALEEIGVNLTGYLASASIVALAISFGSQGLVQDVVIGMTLIFSDAMDAGDLVEIFASTTLVGRIEEIGMRFTLLRNSLNQIVFIPNRTIANVSRFPADGVHVFADVQIPGATEVQEAESTIQKVAEGMWNQFSSIILAKPEVQPTKVAMGGCWSYVRVHFRIWPGQGHLIETTFREQLLSVMKGFQPDYGTWQISVFYREIA